MDISLTLTSAWQAAARLGLPCVLGALLAAPAYADAAKASGHHKAGANTGAAHAKHKAIDYSGKPRKGKASYYGRRFAGKTMADGTPMNPHSNAAASKTLPLGTKARVTNLENGKSAVVEIKDRGPYVPDRIVDLTPNTAKKLAIIDQGVAPVEVTPLELPEQKTASEP